MKNKMMYILVIALGIGCLSGCEMRKKLPLGASENEILSLVPVHQDKELVTIHYEYGLDASAEIEAAIEKTFPDVDIVMVHDGGNNSLSLLEGNLENGSECDLIFSRFLMDMEIPYEDYLLDLSGEEFVNNFYLTALDNCLQKDGGLYFLPGPANVYGIIYDKTMLEENGWNPPTNYSELVALIHTIDHSGLTAAEEIDGESKVVPVRGIRPSMKFTDSFRIQTYPFVYKELFAGKDNLEWITEYQRGDASLVGHMEPFADEVKKLVEDGVLREDDWEYMPRFRLPMLCTYHSTAMIFGPLNTFVNESLINSDHEYGILPIFTDDTEDGDYLYSIPTYFMGINKASAEVSPKRRQLLLDIMEFICSPDSQEKLFGEANTLISNIKGVLPGENSFNAGIQKTLEEGRIISDFQLLAETGLNDNAVDMLNGKITEEEWLKLGDQCRDDMLNGISIYDSEVLGTCEDTLTRMETALMMGQVYRDVTGADIALVYVNCADQGANCRMFAGELDTVVVKNIAPDRTSEEGEGIAYATLTGQQIMDCLNGFDVKVGQSDKWYYIASGLNVEFAPWMPAGERLISCKLPNGKEIDPDAGYTVAYMSDKLFGKGGDDMIGLQPEDEVILEGTWMDHFTKWLDNNNGVVKRPEQTTTLNWKTKQ